MLVACLQRALLARGPHQGQEERASPNKRKRAGEIAHFSTRSLFPAGTSPGVEVTESHEPGLAAGDMLACCCLLLACCCLRCLSSRRGRTFRKKTAENTADRNGTRPTSAVALERSPTCLGGVFFRCGIPGLEGSNPGKVVQKQQFSPRGRVALAPGPPSSKVGSSGPLLLILCSVRPRTGYNKKISASPGRVVPSRAPGSPESLLCQAQRRRKS